LLLFMSPSSSDSLVELQDLSFGYGERRILDRVTLSIPRGKVTALMGASGGGKTTVLRLIGGQCKAQHGQVLLYGASTGQARQDEGNSMRMDCLLHVDAWACCSSLALCSRT
jgi:phospholipid/cholesterol/gamma-HCH transport system ATP-binding protein